MKCADRWNRLTSRLARRSFEANNDGGIDLHHLGTTAAYLPL
jgi:hypothetical protein